MDGWANATAAAAAANKSIGRSVGRTDGSVHAWRESGPIVTDWAEREREGVCRIGLARLVRR